MKTIKIKEDATAQEQIDFYQQCLDHINNGGRVERSGGIGVSAEDLIGWDVDDLKIIPLPKPKKTRPYNKDEFHLVKIGSFVFSIQTKHHLIILETNPDACMVGLNGYEDMFPMNEMYKDYLHLDVESGETRPFGIEVDDE